LVKNWVVFVAFLKQIHEAPDDKKTNQINAFQLIGVASSLDLSGLFEEEVRKMQGWYQKGNTHTQFHTITNYIGLLQEVSRRHINTRIQGIARQDRSLRKRDGAPSSEGAQQGTLYTPSNSSLEVCNVAQQFFPVTNSGAYVTQLKVTRNCTGSKSLRILSFLVCAEVIDELLFFCHIRVGVGFLLGVRSNG
jgi:hypothetical protein